MVMQKAGLHILLKPRVCLLIALVFGVAFYGYGGRTAEELYDDVKDLEDQKKGVIRIEVGKRTILKDIISS